MRILASKRVSGTRVLTRYTFFYYQLVEYSERVLLEASRHYVMIYYYFLFIQNHFHVFYELFFNKAILKQKIFILETKDS